MINAAYHRRVSDKTLNSSWRKASIQEWLLQNFILELDLRSPDLLELVRPLRQKLLFLDGSAAKWSQFERAVRSRNATCRLADIKHLLQWVSVHAFT